MTVLCKVWSSIAAGDSQYWSAILSSLLAIGGALLAGAIAAKATRKATLEGAARAHADALARDDRARIQEGVSLAQALLCEADALWIAVHQQLAPEIERVTEARPLMVLFPVLTDYFTIYKATAAALGKIGSADARTAIVRTFTSAQSFVDMIRMNNGLVERYWDRDELWRAQGAAGDLQRKIEFVGIGTYSVGVLRTWLNLKHQVEQMFSAVNAYLEREGAPRVELSHIVHGATAGDASAIGDATVSHGETGIGVGDRSAVGKPSIGSA